ncbi:MAG: universal stress protein family, partial [Haloquadratum sp. J07HQX50]
EAARALTETSDCSVRLLNVVDSPTEREQGEQFLKKWAHEHDLEDATRIVDDSGNVERAIKREAQSATLIMLGATERGLLSRLISDSLHMQVINEVDAGVILSERPHDRSFTQRLIGRGRRNQ